jgi:hypothetical protein
MTWVSAQWAAGTEYGTNRSAFWRVIRRTLKSLNIAVSENEEEWPSHLVWSNLYKIAPAGGGNPTGKLKKAQEHGCREIFRLELKEYEPRRLLLLTGWHGWADQFLSNDNMQIVNGKFVKATGLIQASNNVICVVACHPQGKNEALWTGEVIAAFG